jgi:hypothetical protein
LGVAVQEIESEMASRTTRPVMTCIVPTTKRLVFQLITTGYAWLMRISYAYKSIECGLCLFGVFTGCLELFLTLFEILAFNAPYSLLATF